MVVRTKMGTFDLPLDAVDPKVAGLLRAEVRRQQSTLNLIASENFAPRAVLECGASALTNKYAEGYPGRRYYGGCEVVDEVESLAVERARGLFGAQHVNVQPHSGAQANAAAFQAVLDPGDAVLGLELAHGGHLSHGMRINFSGHFYRAASYGVDRTTSLIDMDAVADAARRHRPKLIVAGWSSYPRHLDFAAFRQIADEVGAVLLVDMAHFAGLVAAGIHPSPVPHADIVTTTMHKTLGGPRSGVILCRQEWAKRVDSAVFPGQQGGPHQHVVAAKAIAFKLAATAEFRERQRRTVAGAQAIARGLLDGRSGVKVLTGGTDVHLVLADLSELEINGKEAEERLGAIGIIVNRNAVPFDRRPPAVASGLRIGTAALASRGLSVEDLGHIGTLIDSAVSSGSEACAADLAARVRDIAGRYPLYPWLEDTP